MIFKQKEEASHLAIGSDQELTQMSWFAAPVGHLKRLLGQQQQLSPGRFRCSNFRL
jgi:hypothetical protein